MNKSELVDVRPYRETDKNFIYASWLRGLYYGESTYSEMSKQIFMENYHKIIELILNSGRSKVVIACLREDPEVILGYAVLSSDDKIAHWAFVKKAWRGIGIGKSLVPKEVTTFTHLTKVGRSILKKKNLLFNPFVI